MMGTSLVNINSFSEGDNWDKIGFFEVADHLPVGVVFLDQYFKVEQFNRHYASYIDAYSHLAVEEVKGSSYFSMVSGSEKLIAYDFKAIRENKTAINRVNTPLYVDCERGKQVTFWDVNLVPVVNRKGKFKGILLITQEVESRTELSETAKKSGDCFERADNYLPQILAQDFNLTLRETQVANSISKGKTSKEIADDFCVSAACIEFHRNNIRKKLGLKNTGTNLSTFLVAKYH